MHTAQLCFESVWIHLMQMVERCFFSGFICQTHGNFNHVYLYVIKNTKQDYDMIVNINSSSIFLCYSVCVCLCISERKKKRNRSTQTDKTEKGSQTTWRRPVNDTTKVRLRAGETVRQLWLTWRHSPLNCGGYRHSWRGSVKKTEKHTCRVYFHPLL